MTYVNVLLQQAAWQLEKGLLQFRSPTAAASADRLSWPSLQAFVPASHSPCWVISSSTLGVLVTRATTIRMDVALSTSLYFSLQLPLSLLFPNLVHRLCDHIVSSNSRCNADTTGVRAPWVWQVRLVMTIQNVIILLMFSSAYFKNPLFIWILLCLLKKLNSGVVTLPQLEPAVIQVVVSNAKLHHQQSDSILPHIANKGVQNNYQTHQVRLHFTLCHTILLASKSS